MKAVGKGEWADLAVPIGYGLVLCLALPLGGALQFGGDEGYELMKGWLVSQGHGLYGEFWNDQPPLHTELLALIFRVSGPSALAARLLGVSFAMVLVGTFYAMVRRRSGRATGVLAVLLLVGSPSFLGLSVSAMLELPAISTAFVAIWVMDGPSGKGWCRSLVAGALFGAAMQIKFTAALILPAFVLIFLVGGEKPRTDESSGKAAREPRQCLGRLGLGLAAMLGSFALIGLACYGPETLTTFRTSHFSQASLGGSQVDDYALASSPILSEAGLWIPALLGVALYLGGIGSRRGLHLPVVLLFTAGGIHLLHRPYWYYYDLHFDLPCAWLGAVGIASSFSRLWAKSLRDPGGERKRLVAGRLTWALLVLAPAVIVPTKVWQGFEALLRSPTAIDDPIVRELSARSAAVRWIYTDRVIYAFWARIRVPPELAVVPRKRLWSGEFSERYLVDSLERYRPERILLLAEDRRWPAFQAYLDSKYHLDTESSLDRFYLRR